MALAFKGAAKRIDDMDSPKLSAQIGVGEDDIHAFLDSETRGSGFDPQGRPKILFERHKFYKHLPASKRDAAVKAGLTSPKPVGYGKESAQYSKLARAIGIGRKAALYACSWGLAQVVGFKHRLAGYADVEQMVAAFMVDEEAHLQAAGLITTRSPTLKASVSLILSSMNVRPRGWGARRICKPFQGARVGSHTA